MSNKVNELQSYAGPHVPVVVENMPRFGTISDVPHAALPGEYKLRDMERTLKAPHRQRGNFAVETADAFNAQVKLIRKPLFHVCEDSEIVGTAGSAKLARAAKSEPQFEQMPIYFSRSERTAMIQAVLNSGDWRDLTVTLSQRLSDPFGEWLAFNGRGQQQRAFAQFLEERTHHVVKPEGAKLLDLAKKFKATTNVRFQSLVEDVNSNGDGSLEFIQTTQAGTADAKGAIKVPERITLAMPIWHGGDPVQFEARFGYAIADGRLTLSFEILRLNELLSQTLRDLVAKIGQEHPAAVLIEGANASVPALGGRRSSDSDE